MKHISKFEIFESNYSDKGVKKVINCYVDPKLVETEDGGCAKNFHVEDEGDADWNGMYLKLQSWDETIEHTELNELVGKRIKITIEVV